MSILFVTGGVGPGQNEQPAQQQSQAPILFQDPGDRMDSGPGQMSGLWSGAVMQPHQLHQLQQQQLQQQLMLGGHGNMGPIVGHQHQSPPGLGPINMMIGPGPVGGQHGVSMGHMFPVQSPPSSSGQFLHLPQHHQQQQPPRQLGDTVITPNSTPGLQTPTPSATPPIVNVDNRDTLFHNRIVPGQDFEAIGDIDPMMGWRGLQALQGVQGGTLADMFTGVDRQFGLLGNNLERQGGMEPRHPAPGPGFPGGALPVSGFNNFSVAMAQAQQAQENMIRLQQLQQQNPDFLNKQHHHQLPGFPPGSHLPGPEMTRHFPGLPPPQCQSPSPNGFTLPPGPRPRPVGGDSSPPGFPADIIPPNMAEDIGHHLQPPSKGPEQPLVIGSWNDECDKDELGASSLPPLTAPPPSLPHSMTQPPPRLVGADQEWGGTFQIPRGGGHVWGGVEEFHPSDFKKQDTNFEVGRSDQAGDSFRGKRGGRGGGRGAPRGQGGFQSKQGLDHTREKDQGKSAAIEETKALLAKMRLEDKELMSKNKKTGDGTEKDKVPIQPGAYRPRDNRRGRDDRGDRGGRGRGRGRGGMMPHPHQPPMGPMMRMPFIPGDFRTPPFPGMEGFLPPGGMGQFPPQFPAGFPPALFPMSIGEMRGRGGFNRGRGFPIGFPPRGFPPPVIGFRGRGGRGRGQFGGQRNRDFNKRDNVNQENSPENPMMSAIYGNDENGNESDVKESMTENKDEREEIEEQEEESKTEVEAND